MHPSKSHWRTVLLSLALVLFVITAAAVCVFVPLLDRPEPPWPVFCSFGDTPEKVTVLEFVQRKGWWVR